MNESKSHNLDILTYSLPEILELYDLDRRPSIQDMQRAKRKMLMVHPDKSRLPPQYFLFYQKAYNILVSYYNEINKVNQPVVNRDYEAPEPQQPQVETQEHFNSDRFNELFETGGGVNRERQEHRKQRFGWFSQPEGEPDVREEVIMKTQQGVKETKHLNDAFESIRPKVVSSMVVHKEVRPITSVHGANSYFEEEADEQEQSGYISAEIFSKLKFDDIRRVHKDETILPVGESDFSKVQTFKSVEEYQKHRGSVSMANGYMKKDEAEAWLQQQEANKQQVFEQRWAKQQQKIDHQEEQNQRMLSQFMLLTGNNM